MARTNVEAVDMPLGEKKKPRKRVRKCKVCGTPLSMYNDNKYCFSHVLKGFEMEQAKREGRYRANYKRGLAKMRKEEA